MALTAFGLLVRRGVVEATLPDIAASFVWVVGGVIVTYFLYLIFWGGHDGAEKRKIVTIFWFAILATVFWSGFEQAGSSLNLFARDFTDRTIGRWEYPASYLQSVNAFFIVVFAPVFGWLWVWLAKRNANPSTPVKFALGLLWLAAGFLVVAWGAANATAENPASASWLVVMYFFHTVGELPLSPIGLSAVTKLAPARRLSQMMGLWFVATSLGNVVAGLVAGRLESLGAGAALQRGRHDHRRRRDRGAGRKPRLQAADGRREVGAGRSGGEGRPGPARSPRPTGRKPAYRSSRSPTKSPHATVLLRPSDSTTMPRLPSSTSLEPFKWRRLPSRSVTSAPSPTRSIRAIFENSTKNSAPAARPLSTSQLRASSRSHRTLPESSSPETVSTTPRSGRPPSKSP